MPDIITARDFSEWSRVSKLDILTTDEAALYLRIGWPMFDGLVKAGRIKFSRPNGPTGIKRYLRVHLDEFIRSTVTTETGDPPASRDSRG